jgi:hypothetical protein
MPDVTQVLHASNLNFTKFTYLTPFTCVGHKRATDYSSHLDTPNFDYLA